MSDTVFVRMYHPALGNVQVDAPLQAVSIYASHGWLLVGGSTPAPQDIAFTEALGDVRYAKLGDVATPGTATGDALRAAFAPYPAGMELGWAELRTGVNATSSVTNALQDLGTYGAQLTIDPIGRPYEIRGVALLGHSAAQGVVGLRIAEVSNGIDTPLTRIDFQEVPSGTAPFYVWCRPRLRVPVSTNARTFKLQWLITTAGTGTLYTPGSDTSGVATSAYWACEIQAVAL